MVDEYLEYACQILGCSRGDLGIEASPKGLAAGAGLTSTTSIEFIQLPSCFVNDEDGSTGLSNLAAELRVVLIVEKETVFQQLVSMEWYLELERAG